MVIADVTLLAGDASSAPQPATPTIAATAGATPSVATCRRVNPAPVLLSAPRGAGGDPLPVIALLSVLLIVARGTCPATWYSHAPPSRSNGVTVRPAGRRAVTMCKRVASPAPCERYPSDVRCGAARRDAK